jgi:ABC-type multidrug transport system fused ATPase/permease subunit
VILDEHDVRSFNIKWFRNQTGYVGQSAVLFAGSIRENLLLGKPDATEEELLIALEAANAKGFVLNLSNGLDSEVGR